MLLIVKESPSPLLTLLDRCLSPLARHLPESIKAPLRRLARGPQLPPESAADAEAEADQPAAQAAVAETEAEAQAAVEEPATTAAEENPADAYGERLRREQEIFAGQIDVNELPGIFHYWSHNYLRPKLEHFGSSNPDEFFANALQQAYAQAAARPARFVSLGAGNCDTEVRVAQLLVGRGLHDFTIECLDINAAMLERGAAHAREAGVAEQVLPLIGDFNAWQPARRYDAAMANQSLHHVLQLEHLFATVAANLPAHGRFVISDMVGRNGHQRWPEALAIVREFWAELPAAYRYHRQLREQWDDYLDFDCSGEGFEGIRAQDILPLLLQHFAFESYLGFANVIDPFIDRGFGGHFDADSARDRALIDRIHARDEAEMEAGHIKPTHIMAVLRRPDYAGPLRVWHNLTPQHCLRLPG